MKKALIAVLTLTMLLAIAVTASAAKSNYTIYNMPCEAIADNMLYQYHADTKTVLQSWMLITSYKSAILLRRPVP